MNKHLIKQLDGAIITSVLEGHQKAPNPTLDKTFYYNYKLTVALGIRYSISHDSFSAFAKKRKDVCGHIR